MTKTKFKLWYACFDTNNVGANNGVNMSNSFNND